MDESTSRREFVRSMAAGGLAVAAMQSRAFCGDDRNNGNTPGVNFGFSLYGARSLKVSEAIRLCSTTGYDSVELVSVDGWPCDPQNLTTPMRTEIRKQLEDAHLTAAAIMEDLVAVVDATRHEKNLTRLKAAADLGHVVSPNNPPIIETVLGGRPDEWENLKSPMVQALRDWAKVGEQSRTVIAAKAHIGGALHTPDDARWLIKEVGSPWLKLVYDYSHFQLGEFPLDDSLKTMIGETVFIHVKDTEGTRAKFRFLLPGDGKIDYARYFALLKDVKYSGSVTVEVSGQIHGRPDYNPVATIKGCYDRLAPIFAATGIRRAKA